MISSRSFPRRAESVPTARHFVAELISGTSKDIGERVAVMVSELATNAIQHGRTDFDVRVETNDQSIRVEITDSGAGQPTVQSAGAEELSGRGLRIVDVLADSWGVQPSTTGAGKSVWFVVDVP